VAAVAMSVLLAFAFRVVPGYHAVFTAHGISFQEPDAWFHMRTVHNLLAHFPWRSGFDQYAYAVYPLGENVTTGPFWVGAQLRIRERSRAMDGAASV